MTEPGEETRAGAVQPRLAAEFPGLELRWCRMQAEVGRSSAAVRQRLRALSDRYAGARVVAMRTQPIAHAYRAFFRQVGLDPDATRIPSEAAAVARLLQGGFRSQDRISDALLVALVETGVPVWAFDAAALDPASLIVRPSEDGEPLGRDPLAPDLPAGRLVIADAHRPLALLFEAPAEGFGPGPATAAVVLVSVGVGGVPTIYLEEALWLCGEMLDS